MANPVQLVDGQSTPDRPHGSTIGSSANPLVTSASDGAGGVATALPAGRAAAAASVPTALSNEDKAALDKAPGVYRRAAAVSATPGDGLFVAGVTTAGAISVTLGGGGTLSVNVPLGSTILPFGATAASAGSTGATFQSLFFS